MRATIDNIIQPLEKPLPYPKLMMDKTNNSVVILVLSNLMCIQLTNKLEHTYIDWFHLTSEDIIVQYEDLPLDKFITLSNHEENN